MSDLGSRDDAINAVIETLEDQLHDQDDEATLTICDAVIKHCLSIKAFVLAEQERKGTPNEPS